MASSTNYKKALAKLLLVFLEGRSHSVGNPYTNDEVNEAFRALRIDWRDDGDTTQMVRDIARGRRVRR